MKKRKKFKGTRKVVEKNTAGILHKFRQLVDAEEKKLDGLLEKIIHHISIIRELSPRL
jgi:hypothetical protein